MPEYEYSYLNKEHEWTTKKLEVIEGEVPEGLSLMAFAVGTSLQQCIFEGIIQSPNFLKRLAAFKVEGDGKTTVIFEDEVYIFGTAPNYVSVSFYQKADQI